MRTASERARDRRSLRLEFLEDRNLLSTLAVAPAAEVANARTVTTFSGHIQGSRAMAGLYTPTHPGYISHSGSGAGAGVGKLLFSAQDIGTISGSTATVTNGSALLTTYKGANLNIVYTGTGTASGHKPVALTLIGTVTGGTGRFLNETGTFYATGHFAPGTGKFGLSFTISLANPA